MTPDRLELSDPADVGQSVASGVSAKFAYPDLDEVWQAVAPFLRTRKNDVHTPLSFFFAELLLDAHPQADPLVVRLAILLHDSGWSAIDETRILSEGFAANWKTSDVRYLHELEGCRIARELLPPLGYPADVVDRVTAIIDGHDTRPEALSLEDELVRDADRLWRFTPTGIGIASGWFKKTPAAYYRQLCERTFHELITAEGRRMATAELERSRELLKLDVL
ncbi:HD domain-containing protein [Pengzhenrongella phosphoraccumulans]|uniref:HD domain-containing protein n=1 Tax=Pengzhenrongella phosphoraccumulans TaxID=3114394 RepID=UPI00388D719E